MVSSRSPRNAGTRRKNLRLLGPRQRRRSGNRSLGTGEEVCLERPPGAHRMDSRIPRRQDHRPFPRKQFPRQRRLGKRVVRFHQLRLGLHTSQLAGRTRTPSRNRPPSRLAPPQSHPFARRRLSETSQCRRAVFTRRSSRVEARRRILPDNDNRRFLLRTSRIRTRATRLLLNGAGSERRAPLAHHRRLARPNRSPGVALRFLLTSRASGSLRQKWERRLQEIFQN